MLKIRARAIRCGPLKRDASSRQIFIIRSYKLAIKLSINSIVLQFEMNDTLVLSSPPQKENGEWPTPVRATVRSLQRDGYS